MNLREWDSNCDEFNQWVPEADRSKCAIGDGKVLGLGWDTSSDLIWVKSNLEWSEVSSKRDVLHNTASVFDPHGVHSPLTVQAKMLIQKLWAEK